MEAACVTTQTFHLAEPDSLPGSVPRSPRHAQADPVLTAEAYVINLGHTLRDRRRRANWRVAGVCTEELLHSVVALYDSGLPNVGSDGLYATVCAKGALTIMLLRNKEAKLKDDDVQKLAIVLRRIAKKKKNSHYYLSDYVRSLYLVFLLSSLSIFLKAMESYRRRSQKGAVEWGSMAAHANPSSGSNGLNDIVPGKVTGGQAAGAGSSENAGAVQPATGECGTGGGGGGTTGSDEEAVSNFAEVYSDTDSSEESSSSSEEEEVFSGNIDQFLQDVRSRRREREAAPDNISTSSIGVECCLLSALTYNTSRTTSGEKVFILQLLTTRKRFRKYGLGRFLLQMLKQLLELLKYDAILVHADSRAVSFFMHHGFSDDVILNSKFKEYTDDWINTTMMSYFPQYRAGLDAVTKETNGLDVKKMDLEIKFWRDRSLAANQAQAVCVARMKTEILSLRDQLLAQKKHIEALEMRLQLSHEQKSQLRMESMSSRLRKVEELHAGIRRFTGVWMRDREDNPNLVVSTQATDAGELPGMQHETSPSPPGAGVLTTLMGALGIWDVMEKSDAMGAGVTVGTSEAMGPREAAESRDLAVGRSDRGPGEEASCDEFKWSAL